MKVSFDIPASRAALAAALEGLVATNYLILGSGNFPSIYRSGVVYRPELAGVEEWRTVPQVIRAGWGDCEDLASWRAAELRIAGVPAQAAVVRTGPRRFHAVVRYPDGQIEDPSRRLGMLKGKR